MANISTSEPEDGYKAVWARYIARKSLDDSIKHVKVKLAEASDKGLLPKVSNKENPSLREIAQGRKLTFGSRPKEDGKFKVGIIGAGVSGLFTALLIDWLNNAKETKGKLKIEYDILEANGPQRVGGRLFTKYFTNTDPDLPKSNQNHIYYDVGAMRFPENKVMERTFRLFNFLGITKATGEEPNPGQLRRYYFYDQAPPNGVIPTYFNGVRKVGTWKQYNPNDEADPFKLNDWVQGDDKEREKRKIPKSLIKQSPGDVEGEAIKSFTDALKKDLERHEPGQDPSKDPTGWDKLMDADYMSTREFLRTKATYKDDQNKDVIGYNFNTIEWLETFSVGTGWYNQALAETVLEALDFDPPDKVESNDYWWCLDGGTQQIANKMVDRLAGKKPEVYRRVTSIYSNHQNGDIELTIQDCEPDGKRATEQRSYFTVFNSTTLGALQMMDLTKADLNYGTKQAIRSLNYGASCKVGIKFETGWWMLPPYNINKGGVGKTDLPLRVCVYPSYNVGDDYNKSCVLLCSYSWAQDAQRIGGLISPHSPKNEEDLKELLLENLARLHAPTDDDYKPLLERLHREYQDHYAHDWYADSNMLGAFGYFGPGQFSQMWPEIIKPSGWLFFIGEVASAHHGWICGAIESSVRGVYQLLETLQLQGKEDPEWDFEGYQLAMDLLVGTGKVTEHDVPFIGLPKEIPKRQLGTGQDTDLLITPDGKGDLTFTAAQVISSFIELAISIVENEAPGKAQDSQGSQAIQPLQLLTAQA